MYPTRRSFYTTILLAALSILLGGAISCKPKSTPEDLQTHSVLINEVKLIDVDNKTLEKTFFSIDHRQGRIYNAHKLPLGTKIGKVKLRIKSDPNSTPTIYIGGVEQPFTGSDIVDMTDYAKGVRIHMENKNYPGISKDYSFEINVYDKDPYTYTWERASGKAPMPNGGKALLHSRLVECVQAFYYMSRTAEGVKLWRAAKETPTEWTEIAIGSSLDASVVDIAAMADDGVFALQSNRSIASYTHHDKEWIQSNVILGDKAYLLGSIDYRGVSTPLCAIEKGGKMYFQVEGGAPVPSNFPIEGATRFSQTIETHPVAMLLGTETSDGFAQVWSSSNGFDWLTPHNRQVKSGITASKEPGSIIYEPRDHSLLLLLPTPIDPAKPMYSPIRTYVSTDRGDSWKELDCNAILPESYRLDGGAFSKGLSLYRDREGRLYLFGGLRGGDAPEIWVGTPIRF